MPPPGLGAENKPLGVPPAANKAGAGSAEGELTNRVDGAPGFGNLRLNAEQEDEIFLQLAETLS